MSGRLESKLRQLSLQSDALFNCISEAINHPKLPVDVKIRMQEALLRFRALEKDVDRSTADWRPGPLTIEP